MPRKTERYGAARRWRIPGSVLALAALSLALDDVRAGATQLPACAPMSHHGHAYTVCRFDAAQDVVRLFLSDGAGAPYGHFDRLRADLDAEGETLAFAMNAGMYHTDLSPVGLFIADGRELRALNRASWVGNFYLKPNGVFFVGGGRAGVLETEAYLASGIKPRFATQSGPMLVVDGKLHPRFLVDATSRHIRNGVGVLKDGRTVVFAISDEKVTFHEFGTFFRDGLEAPNALYLDGSISRLYAPELGRNDGGEAMGPIVAVTISRGRAALRQGEKP